MTNRVYLLRCGDGTLYCGWTNDLPKRLARHAAGRGARYTAARLPCKLEISWACATSRQARQGEWLIKRLSKPEKEKLLLQPETFYALLNRWLEKRGEEPCEQSTKQICGDVKS